VHKGSKNSGNEITNYSQDRYIKNKSVSRYHDSIFNKKQSHKRENILREDRLHILERMSNSIKNDNSKLASDFSDARSIK
jgi:hypothetical protein